MGLTLAVLLAGTAWAVNLHTIKASVSPSKVSKTRFNPASLNFTTAATCQEPCGGTGAITPATRVRIYIDDDLKLYTRGLATCRASQVEGTTTAQAKAACGRALVGSGRTVVVIGGDPDNSVQGRGTLFNGVPRGGRPTLLVHSRTDRLGFTTVLNGVIKRASGDYGVVLDVRIPPLPLNTALIEFQAKLHRSYNFQGKRRNYISARCFDPNRTWDFKGIDYYDATPSQLAATATQKCQVQR